MVARGPYDVEGAAFYNPSFACTDCLRSSPVGCSCERGRELEDDKDDRCGYAKIDDKMAEQEEAARVADLDRRVADREASMARAEAAAKAKAATHEVDSSDCSGAGDGSYSLAEIKAGETLRQLRSDREAVRRAHSFGADPDAP